MKSIVIFDHLNSKTPRYTNQHQYDEESFTPNSLLVKITYRI